MRRTLIPIGMLTLIFLSSIGQPTISVLAAGEDAASGANADDRWPETLLAEQQLADFQERASGRWCSRLLSGRCDSVACGGCPNIPKEGLQHRKPWVGAGAGRLEVLEPKFERLERARASLRAIGNDKLAGGGSMATFFDAEREKIRVVTSLSWTTLSRGLDDLAPIVEYSQGDVRPTLGRFNDTSPFWGGAAYDVADWGDPYSDCSTGFTVINGSGQKGLVTAAHCGPINRNALTPDNDRIVGTLGNKHCQEDSADVMLISGKDLRSLHLCRHPARRNRGARGGSRHSCGGRHIQLQWCDQLRTGAKQGRKPRRGVVF